MIEDKAKFMNNKLMNNILLNIENFVNANDF